MPTLQKMLGKVFKPAATRQPDPYRKSRAEAKRLAAEIGVEIEAMKPGFNVWPPKALDDSADEFQGDHYAEDWNDVLTRVAAYTAALKTCGDTHESN